MAPSGEILYSPGPGRYLEGTAVGCTAVGGISVGVGDTGVGGTVVDSIAVGSTVVRGGVVLRWWVLRWRYCGGGTEVGGTDGILSDLLSLYLQFGGWVSSEGSQVGEGTRLAQ